MSESEQAPETAGCGGLAKAALVLVLALGAAAGLYTGYRYVSPQGRRERALESLGREELAPFVRDRVPQLLPDSWDPAEGWSEARQAPLRAAIGTGRLAIEVSHQLEPSQKLQTIASLQSGSGTLPPQLLELVIQPLVPSPPPAAADVAAASLYTSNTQVQPANADRGPSLVFYTDYGNLFRSSPKDLQGFAESFEVEGIHYRASSSLGPHLVSHTQVEGPDGTIYRVLFRWAYDAKSLVR